jgi:hypothetical protein
MKPYRLIAVWVAVLVAVGWWLSARDHAADPARSPAGENKRLVYIVK